MSGLCVLKRFLGSVLMALLLGCAEGGTSGTGAGLVDPIDAITGIHSTEQRITEPQVEPNDQASQVAGNVDFAFDLYQTIRSENTNLFYSPHSISLALAMVHAGARNDTEAQMAKVLHFVLEQEKLHPVFNALDLELDKRGGEGAGGGAFRLDVTNAIWGQDGYVFLEEFLDTLAINYGAGMKILDFVADPEKSRVTINDWVADQTEDRISDLIPAGVIDADTRLVLTNTIYFTADWMHPFDVEDTEAADFYLIDGSTVEAQMMSQQISSVGHAEGADYQAIQLLYGESGEGSISMLIVVPDRGELDSVEQFLDGDMIQSILGLLESKRVNLKMPKFEFSADLPLKRVLSEMGMTDAFDGTYADFSGISDQFLYIRDVLHQAYVKVDEEGTEAAAATGVVTGTTGVPEAHTLIIDRPFIFLIRDHDTGVILFLGRVMDPTA